MPLKKSSNSESVASAGISRCIQYIGRSRPSTTRWNSLVFSGSCDFVVSILAILCLQYFKCWVIFDLSNSPLQKSQLPFDVSLVAAFFAIFILSYIKFRWQSLKMLLVGLRPTWRREKVRGHLALRQGTLSPAPLFLILSNCIGNTSP